MKKFVTTEWLNDHLEDPNLRILDATIFFADPDGEFIQSGEAHYADVHLAKATFVDQLRFSDEKALTPFTIIDHDRFIDQAEQLGLKADDTIVVYDSGAEVKADYKADMWAARFAWQLSLEGFLKVYILEGGLGKWLAEGRPVTTEVESYPASQLELSRQEDLYASLEEVKAAQKDESVALLDVLPKAQYEGEIAPFGEERKGHIPTAVNVFYGELADERTGKLLPKEVLEEKFSHLLKGKSTVITYCGFGVAASWTFAILKELGYEKVKVFDDSLMTYAVQTDLPLKFKE